MSRPGLLHVAIKIPVSHAYICHPDFLSTVYISLIRLLSTPFCIRVAINSHWGLYRMYPWIHGQFFQLSMSLHIVHYDSLVFIPFHKTSWVNHSRTAWLSIILPYQLSCFSVSPLLFIRRCLGCQISHMQRAWRDWRIMRADKILCIYIENRSAWSFGELR